MKRRTKIYWGIGLVLAAIVIGSSIVALAGPPLVCFPYDIGNARSLPWGPNDALSYDARSGWNAPRADYDLDHLVADTLGLLTSQMPVIVRMETLRRAAIYAQKRPWVAKELLFRLRTRALDAEAAGRPDALAFFDFGYLVETCKQVNGTYQKTAAGGWRWQEADNPAMSMEGKSWIAKALSLRANDPQMQFAAAVTSCTEMSNGLCTNSSEERVQREHVERALAGLQEGSLLARNLMARFGGRGGTIDELRARFEAGK